MKVIIRDQESYDNRHLMDQELKDAWVKALKSGKYKQHSERCLKYDNGVTATYCPMGVLCDIHPQIYWGGTHGLYSIARLGELAEHAVIPSPLTKNKQNSKAANSDYNGIFVGFEVLIAGTYYDNILSMNDRENPISFVTIAEVIEKHF